MSKFSNYQTLLYNQKCGDYWFDYVNQHIKIEPTLKNPIELAEIMRKRVVDKLEETTTDISLFDELLKRSIYAINFYEVAQNILNEIKIPA